MFIGNLVRGWPAIGCGLSMRQMAAKRHVDHAFRRTQLDLAQVYDADRGGCLWVAAPTSGQAGENMQP
jgi:hypothetical protein